MKVQVQEDTLSDFRWLADAGSAGLVVIALIVILRWVRSLQEDMKEAMKLMAKAVDKNSVSVVTLGQSIVGLVTILAQKPCVSEDLQGQATALIEKLKEAQENIISQGNGS